jgi:hypothetical protein
MMNAETTQTQTGESTMTNPNAIYISTARAAITRTSRHIVSWDAATVTFPPYDPCKARQPVARVDVPAVYGAHPVTLTHFIMDGDAIH